MIRRLLFLLLAVIVPVGVVLLAGWPIVSKNNWARQRLHEVLTIGLAQQLDSEVRVGEITGNLATGFRVDGIAISDGPSFADGTLLSARQLHVKCNTWKVIRRETPPIEAVKEVRIVGLWGKFVRGPDGKLNIERLLPERKPPKEPPKARFGGRIILEDAELLYSDNAAEPAALSGIDLHVNHVDAIADFARPNVIEYRARLDSVRAPFEQVEAQGAYGLADHAVSLNARVTGADLPALYNRFVNNPALTLQSGTVDAMANVCAIPGEFIDYTVIGHASQLSADVAALGGERVVGKGSFTVTPAGATLDDIHLSALGASISGKGSVFDWTSLTLDLEASAENVNLTRWAELVPEVTASLPEATGVNSVRLAGSVTGPISDPDITVAAEFPAAVDVRYAIQSDENEPEPEPPEPAMLLAQASGMSVSASIPDIKTQDVLVRVTADELSVSDLGVLLPEQEYIREATPAPIHNLEAEIFYSRQVATAGRLVIDEIGTDRGPIQGLDVRYALVGTTIRAEVAAESVLGAELAAKGLVDLSGERPAVYVQFDADSIDLATVASIAGQEELNVEGRVGASGALSLRDGEFEMIAEASGRALRMETIEVDHLAANVGVTGETVQIHYLTASSPLGAVWAQGTVPFEGPMEVEIAVAELPLGRVQAAAEGFGGEEPDEPSDDREDEAFELTGFAFLHGQVRGEPNDPRVTADIVAFDAGVGEWTAAVTTASIEATPENVQVSDLLVRRGTGVVSADLALTGIAWPPGSFFSDEEASTDDADQTQGSPIDGSLEGSAHVAGLDLSQIGEFVELPEGLRIAGVIESDIDVSGTLQDPEARGRVSAANLKTALEEQDIAVGPLTFDGIFEVGRNTLVLHEASASSDSGALRLAGELSGWNAEDGTSIVAEFEARDLPISAYTPTEGPAALLEGAIDRVAGKVAGPLGDPWPNVSGKLEAHEVRFGRRTLRDVAAEVRYQNHVIEARNVGCRVAGGELQVPSARYWIDDGRVFAEVGADGLQVPDVLFLVGDIVSHGSDDPDAIALRDRIYGYGHRLRGTVSAKEVVVRGTPESLNGRVAGLRTQGAEFDRKELPDIEEIGFRFAGLAVASEGEERATEAEDDSESGPPPALAHLQVDDIRIRTERIGEGRVVVHGGELGKGGSIHWDGNVDLVVEANPVPVAALDEWLPTDLDLGGDLDVTIRAQGPMSGPEIEASVDVFGPTVAGIRFDLLHAAHIKVEPDRIVMTDGLLKRDLYEITAVGEVPFDRDRFVLDTDGEAAFHAQVDQLPPSVLFELANEFTTNASEADAEDSFWSRCRATGSVTAVLDVTGKLLEPEIRGRAYIDPGATFRLADWPKDSTIADIGADIKFRPSPTGVGAVVDASETGVTWRWQDTEFSLKGKAELSHLTESDCLRNRIEGLTLTATAPKQRLPGGTLAKELEAVVTARTDASGRHIVEVEKASARLGRGTLTVDGKVFIDTLDPKYLGHLPCDLRLNLDGAQISYGNLLKRAQVDGVVVARKFASRTGRPLPDDFMRGRTSGDSMDPAIPIRIASVPDDAPGESGFLEITRARIGVPGKKKTPEAEEDDAEAEPPEPSGEKRIHGLASTLPAPELDLTVAIGHHVRLDMPLVNGELVPDREAITLTKTPQAPVIAARASLRRGSIRLLRGNLNIPEARAKIDIEPVSYIGDEPPVRRELKMTSELYGRAEGTVSGTTLTGERIGPLRVQLELSGGLPPDHVLTASSTPPLTDAEVYELLAVGPLRPGHEMAPDRTLPMDEMIAQTLAKQVFRGVLEPLEEELSAALGLEELELTVGLDQAVGVRVGKYLIEDLLVSYTRSVGGGPEDQFDLRLSYDLKDQYQVTWHTDEDERQELAFEYRWRF